MKVKKRVITLLALISLTSVTLCWIYYSFDESNIWSISIYTGTNPFEFSPHPLVQRNPVLRSSDVTDVPARFVADPFMVQHNNTWYMFFEVLNASSDQGDIGLASSEDGFVWKYEKIILDEPFHLSYPYVFKWNESYYMIPESRRASAVRLYKAEEFPFKWKFVSDLIVGNYADPSIVFKNGKWWLFVLKNWDTLSLHYAENLNGPWVEHPESPLIKGDKNISRPGGRLIVYNDKITRYTQDCDPIYGNELRAFQIDEISTTKYVEHEIAQSPVLTAGGTGWNANGMHHIDPHLLNEANWIACVDGKRKEKVFLWKQGCRFILRKVKQLTIKVFTNTQENSKQIFNY